MQTYDYFLDFLLLRRQTFRYREPKFNIKLFLLCIIVNCLVDFYDWFFFHIHHEIAESLTRIVRNAKCHVFDLKHRNNIHITQCNDAPSVGVPRKCETISFWNSTTYKKANRNNMYSNGVFRFHFFFQD